MAYTIVQKFARDAQAGQPFATDWVDDGSGNLKALSIDSKQLPSGVDPVTGDFSAQGQVSASFSPLPGRDFNVSTWGAANLDTVVGLFRSFDDGVTWIQIDALINQTTRVFSEPESGVLYQLQALAYNVGVVNYRLSQ